MLVVAILICAAVRLYLIDQAVIAADGTIYLEMARKWTTNPMEVVKGYDYPPGYPVATVGVHRFLVALGLTDRRELWEYSGRIVSLVSNLAALVAIWIFAGSVLDWRIATIAVLLFGVGKKWAHLGANVLSDSLAICFQLWAVVLLLKCLSLLRRKSRWALLAAGCVGILAGLGYLARPESLWVALVAATVWLGRSVIRRANVSLTLASIAVMCAAVLAVAGPYMRSIGGLSNKGSVNKILKQTQDGRVPAAAVATATASLTPSTCIGLVDIWTGSTLQKMGGQFSEAMHPILGILCFVWVAGLAVKLLLRGKTVDLPLPIPNNAGKAIMVAAAAIILPILAMLHLESGYLSHRHISFLAALLSPLAVAGIMFLAGMLTLAFKSRGAPANRALWVTPVIVGAVFVGLSYHTLHCPHRDKAHIRQAGLYISGMAGSEDVLLTDDARMGYYAGITYRLFDPKSVTATKFREMLEKEEPAATLVAFSEKELLQATGHDPALAGLFQGSRSAKLGEFLKTGANDDKIVVYRVSQLTSMSGR